MVLKLVFDSGEAEKLQVALEAFDDSGDAHVPVLSRQLCLLVRIFKVLKGKRVEALQAMEMINKKTP